MSTTPEVLHQERLQRFEIRLEGGICHADYRRVGSVLDIFHTEVPESLEGRGLASSLVRAAFDYARSHDMKIRPSCSYVRAWAKRHPEVTDLLDR